MNFNEMSISQLVSYHNERADKPVKTFRDKATAVARVSALAPKEGPAILADMFRFGQTSRVETTTDSPGFRRMSTKLGPEEQEALRLKVLADQAAATKAVAVAPQATAGADTPTPARVAAPKGPNPASGPKKEAKNRTLFKTTDVIEVLDLNTARYRGDWLDTLKKLKDGMTVQAFIDKGGRRRIIRRLLRRKMIRLHAGR